MNRLTLTPTVALALALAAMSAPAFAQPSPSCFTGSIFGGPFVNGPQCFVAQTINPGTGSAFVPPAKPAPVSAAPAAPAVPTSVPASTLTPATPAPGVITGNVADTPYAGAAPGYYENVSFNGGTYNAIVAPDGTYIARPVP